MGNFYREERIIIKGGELKEINYGLGESPNHFYVKNLSQFELYCGISLIPSKEVNEMTVKPNSAKITARRDGSTKFYIQNSNSTEEVQVLLTSFNQAFDPVILAMLSQDVSATIDLNGDTGLSLGDIIIKSFDTSLPYGTNTIGNVNLNSGNNKIGAVDVTSLPIAVQNAAAAINSYIATMNTNLTDSKLNLDSIKQEVQNSNLIWTNAKINQLLAAVAGIQAVAGGEEVPGTLEQKVMSLASTTSYWDLSEENRYINKIHHLRCLSGTVKVFFNSNEGVTDWVNQMITLNEGDCLNDISGMIDYLILQGTDSTSRAEILYSYISTATV